MATKQNRPTLADIIRADVDEASIAAMDATSIDDAGNMADEEITKRVLQLKVDAGNAILEIGRWLTVMKSRKEHGEWMAWLEEVDIHVRAASRYIRLYDAYSANWTTLSNLGPSKALTLLALPESERETFVETHDVLNMSVRELDDAIKRQRKLEQERDEAEAAARVAQEERNEAEEEMQRARRELENANARIKDLESAPKEVFQDEAAIKKAADDARAAAEAEWSAKVKAVQDKLAKAEAKAKKAAERSENAGAQSDAKISNLQAEADRLRQELEAAKREQTKASISGDADLAAFQLLFEQIQTDVNKMHGLLLKVRGREDTALGEKLTAALLALADKVKECAK